MSNSIRHAPLLIRNENAAPIASKRLKRVISCSGNAYSAARSGRTRRAHMLEPANASLTLFPVSCVGGTMQRRSTLIPADFQAIDRRVIDFGIIARSVCPAVAERRTAIRCTKQRPRLGLRRFPHNR